MSTGFQPVPSGNFQQPMPQAAPMPQGAEIPRAQQMGEQPMSPNVGQRQGFPTWDASASMAQRVQNPAFMQQQAPQPQFQPAPQFQQQPFQQQPPQFQPQQFQQPAPQPQPNWAQPARVPQVLGPDSQAPQPYQFNDGLNLAGPMGGHPGPGQQAPAPPQFAPQPGQQLPPPVQQPFGQQAPTTVRDRLMQLGAPVGHYQNDDQLLSDLGSAATEIQQLRHYARLGIESNRQLLGQQQQQPPQTGAQQQQLPTGGQQSQQPQKPQRPEWRPEWESLVRYDAQTGQYKPVDPMAVNPMIVERANEWHAYRRRTIDNLATDPAGAVWESGLQDRVTQEVERRIQAFTQQQTEAQRQREANDAFDGFVQQNAQQFFQVGQDGQPIRNPFSGEFALTPRGQSFRAHASRYSAEFQGRYGHAPDPRDVLGHVQMSMAQEEFARMAQGQQGQPAWQPQGQPGFQPQPQPWQQHGLQAPQPYQPAGGAYGPLNQNQALLETTVQQALQRARYAPNQNGTEVSQTLNGVPQNPNLTFQQLLRQAAVQRGLAPQ